MTRSHLALFVAAGAIALPATAGAERIRQIVVDENSKTTDDTVIYIAGIEEGDDWSNDIQEQVRIDLVSSGLFKDVQLFSEPHPKGGVKVTILAQDKHSWIIAPTYYNQPTNKGGGVGFGENNLFGQAKKLLLYGQIATGDSFFIGAYVDPSIAGTGFHWQWDVFLRHERTIEYRPPRAYVDEDPLIVRESKMNYLNSGATFGYTLLRSLTLDGRLRGARVSFSETTLGEFATETDVGLEEGCVAAGTCEVAAPGAEGWDVSTEAILKFDRRANWYGITTGTMFKATLERSLPGLGSDFDYWYSGAGIEHSRRFFKTHNLVMKLGGGYGKDMPFQQEYTAGGTTLRGYKNRQFRGDLALGSNLEYSLQLISIKGVALRTLVFADARYTRYLNPFDMDETCGGEICRNYLPGSLDVTDFDPSVEETGSETFRYMRTSVGAGARLYIRQIVLPLLGLDLGYGLESGGVEIYFAIGLTDF